MGITKAGFAVGFVGDLYLQKFTDTEQSGLKDYFAQHGFQESLMLGSMITGEWAFVYEMLGLDPIYLPIYGLALDELYRQAYPLLFPSLKGYYEKNSRVKTLTYNFVVGLLIYLVDKFIK